MTTDEEMGYTHVVTLKILLNAFQCEIINGP